MATVSDRPSAAGAPPEPETVTPPRRHRGRALLERLFGLLGPVHSMRVRFTLFYIGILACAGAILLLFVNAAAHLAAVPVTTVQIPDPTSGFTIDRHVVDLAEAQARSQTLAQLRFFSVLGFIALVAGGFALGSYVAGQALQPMAHIAAVARRISGRNLKERIAMDGPDDELKQLADAFDDMVGRLDGAFEQQRQFVADASHELRTPLTALQTNLEAVRTDPTATLDDYRHAADVAADATRRMRRLVEDLLALADSDRRPAPARVMLAPVAQSVLEELEPLATARGVEIEANVAAGVVVAGDQLSLRRALTNLVENGIRYNRRGGHVTVESVAAPAGWVAVAVRDDGIGIPLEAQPHIFDRFFRVDPARNREDGGSGLGLSIVAKIASEHGGRVDVESVPGRGSRFTLALPAVTPPGSAAGAGAEGDEISGGGGPA